MRRKILMSEREIQNYGGNDRVEETLKALRHTDRPSYRISSEKSSLIDCTKNSQSLKSIEC